MSTITVANISDGTDTVATTYVTNGTAKMTIEYTTLSSTVINESSNVASITDVGTGYSSIYFTNLMASFTFPAMGSGDTDAGSSYNFVGPSFKSPTQLVIETVNTAGNSGDTSKIGVAVFGDIA